MNIKDTWPIVIMCKPKLKVNNIIQYTILRTLQPANSSNYTHDVKEQDFRYFSLFSKLMKTMFTSV